MEVSIGRQENFRSDKEFNVEIYLSLLIFDITRKCFSRCLLLGAFAELRKATISFLMSFRLSA